MNAESVKYASDQLFHAISFDKDTTTVYFIYFTHHKLDATQVLNGLPCILYEYILVNPNDFINRSDIERASMCIWDKEKCNFTDPNELHN